MFALLAPVGYLAVPARHYRCRCSCHIGPGHSLQQQQQQQVAQQEQPPPLLRPAVALDVEFSHYRSPRGAEVAVAAWVALVDEGGAVLLDTHVRQECQVRAGRMQHGPGNASSWNDMARLDTPAGCRYESVP